MTVKTLTTPEWDALYQLSGRRVFFHPDWRAIHGDVEMRGVFEGGELFGGGLIYQFKKWGIRVACNPPYMPYLPVCIVGDQPAERIGEVLRLIYDQRSIDIRVPLHFPMPALTGDFAFENRPTHRMPIDQGEEELWKGVASTKRNTITRAAREGYTVKINDHPELAISCYRDTMKRQGMGFPDALFQRMLSGDYNHLVYSLNVYFEGEMVHSFLTAYDQHEAYNIASGKPSGVNDKFAGSFGQWEALLHAKKLGIPVFDFCGSSISGISKFFKLLGGQPADGLRIKRNMKWINSLQDMRKKLPF